MPNLLQSPKPISEGELQNKIAYPYSMCFEGCNQSTGEGYSIQYHCQSFRFGLVIKLFGNNFAQMFNKKQRRRFIKTRELCNNKQIQIYTFSYGIIEDFNQNGISNESEPYHLYQPRVKKKENQNLIKNTDELLGMVGTKSFLFYTGAGISAGSVPMMSELRAMLGLVPQGKVTNDMAIMFIKDVLENTHCHIAKMKLFYEKCFFSKPKLAHHLLKIIALQKHCSILTENIDLLHQRTGFDAMIPSAQLMKDKDAIESLKRTDVVVCIGLSYDDRGFLGWYKHCNSKGQIISLNIDSKSVNYLGKNDLHMTGDGEQILTNLFSYAYEKQSLNNEKKLRIFSENARNFPSCLILYSYERTRGVGCAIGFKQKKLKFEK